MIIMIMLTCLYLPLFTTTKHKAQLTLMMNIGRLIMNLSIFNLMVALEEQERLTQVNTVHPQWNINF